MLGLLGTWKGRGRGQYPTLDADFTYGQEVTFSHDGRPFLHYEARAWLLDAEDAPLRPNAELLYAVQRAFAEYLVATWKAADPSRVASVLLPTVPACSAVT